MNKKNIIKLTESELKNVISESVKRVLSELDHRTVQWAVAERDRRNRDVIDNYNYDTEESSSQYAPKYKKKGKGDTYRGWHNEYRKQDQRDYDALLARGKRAQEVGDEQAYKESMMAKHGMYDYVKGHGWVPKARSVHSWGF